MMAAVGGTRSSDLLNVRLDGDKRLRLVWLHGELDLSTIRSLDDTLAIAIRDRPELLLVDLRNLTFMGVTGLHSLLEVDRACRATGSRLVLVRGPRPVQRLFDVAGLSEVFEWVIDPHDGIAPMRQRWERVLSRAEQEAPKAKQQSQMDRDRVSQQPPDPTVEQPVTTGALPPPSWDRRRGRSRQLNR